MCEAEGGDCGKLENKVGPVKGEAAPAQPQQTGHLGIWILCCQIFWGFKRSEKTGFLCEIFNISAPGTSLFGLVFL